MAHTWCILGFCHLHTGMINNQSIIVKQLQVNDMSILVGHVLGEWVFVQLFVSSICHALCPRAIDICVKST